MSVSTGITAGVLAGLAGLIALLKPLLSSARRIRTEVTISVGGKDGVSKSVVLHGETGDEAIQKILKNLVEDKNGNNPPSAK
jgi:hypothetical protein